MDGSHAHLIGIGGNGMRALAEVLRGWGWSISGSDLMFQGHAAENLPANTDIAIYSDAVPPDNPELRRAAELGIRVLSYFQALGKISCRTGFQPVMKTRQVRNLSYKSGQVENGACVTLAIAGTHGKSTTTALAAHILTQAARNPTVFCGAAPIDKTSGGQAGRKDFFVVEACEYRKNFLHLRPKHAALLGIEADHFDCFKDLQETEAAFKQFAELIPSDGLLLYREDCPTTQKVVKNLACRTASFGFSPQADWSAQNLRHDYGYYQFSIFKRRQLIPKVLLPIPGKYNILNALAAAALCWENGVSAEQIREGLQTFPGLQCRFEISHCSLPRAGASEKVAEQVKNLSYVMDYAHHPTEVAVTLQTVREVFPNRRIWCIFQPHQASRTVRLLDEMACSLQNADKVIVAEIFRAREGVTQPGEVTAADLANRVAEIAKVIPRLNPFPTGAGTNIRRETEVLPVYQADDIIYTLETQVQAGDVVVTLGAGDIHSVLGVLETWDFKTKNLKPKTQKLIP